ncbi:MAG: hypothetical protein LUE27_02640, partial [Clostridia bacterium]|nr:hypothetical protein [Clostridia bacterium]
ARLGGVSTASQMKEEAFRLRKLPFMFSGWEEYRDYLTDRLIREEDRAIFHKAYSTPAAMRYKSNDLLYDDYCKECIKSVLRADVCLTLVQRFKAGVAVAEWEYWKKTGKKKYRNVNPYINWELKHGNGKNI